MKLLSYFDGTRKLGHNANQSEWLNSVHLWQYNQAREKGERRRARKRKMKREKGRRRRKKE